MPPHLVFEFMKALGTREAAMQHAPGCLGMLVEHRGAEVYEVCSMWLSIPDWEAWSAGKVSRLLTLPTGVLQYAPGKGEGFPEDYVPFKDMAGEVPNAKY